MRRSFLFILMSVFLLGWLGSRPTEAAAPPQTGEITGTVLAFGSPAAGATVTLYGGVGYIDWVAQTTTNSSGTFRLRRVPAGSYNLVANRFALGMICQGSQPVAVVAGLGTNVTVAMDCVAIPP